MPVERITSLILTLRGQRVIIDADLARLYGVSTKRLNEQVKRNANRFPEDFVFELSPEERDEVLRSQNATSNGRRGGRRYLPHAFTEHGALMAANVLNSERAVEVSVFVVRAFIQQRELLAAHSDLALKLERLEKKLLAGIGVIHEHDDLLATHDAQIEALIEAIHALRASPGASRRPIGFQVSEGEEG